MPDDVRFMIDAITDYAIYRLDPAGIVTTWNAGAERTKGYGAAEIVGEHFAKFFTAEDQAAGKPGRALAVARATGRFEEEGWRVRKNGTRFWAGVVMDAILNERGELTGFAKITRDLTERRAAQEALQRSERHFRLLMESVVDYAIYTLDPDGRVTSWNSGAARTKGYAREEIIGEHFGRFFTPEDQAAGKPESVLAAARAAGRFEEEGWRVRKDGTRFWASVVLETMRSEDGAFIGFAKVTRDITDRLVLEQAKERLYQTQKMQMVGQFSGGVAHDFNNLLSVVMGSLELIAKASDDVQVRRLTRTAFRAAERGARLTHQLLAYSQRQVLRPQLACVNELAKGFETELLDACGESVALRLCLSPDLWPIDIDPAQFRSALLSLAVNAREAMPRGGALTIATRNVVLDPAVAAELTDIAPGPYVAITIEDTGTGMSAEVRARAAEPFFGTKSTGRGSGLGLSQLLGFVRQSKGQMKIRSETGHGTSVTIYLPKSTMAAASEADVALKEDKGDRRVVLVVEDDPDVLEMATEAVRHLGYDALAAPHAAAALQILEHDQWVDLLFTDVVMPPGKNGVELAQDACRLRPALRVLLASGYPREALQDSLQAGVAFLPKPYTMATLGGSLAELSGRTLN